MDGWMDAGMWIDERAGPQDKRQPHRDQLIERMMTVIDNCAMVSPSFPLVVAVM